MKTRRRVRSVGFGEMILASTGTGMLMHCFVHGPQSMPALIRGTLGQLIDPHIPGRSSTPNPATPAPAPSHFLAPDEHALLASTNPPSVLPDPQPNYFAALSPDPLLNLPLDPLHPAPSSSSL